MTDPIIQRIESFRCSRGQLVAERRNRGYTLYRAGSGTPIARLRPIGQNDRVEVLYWSLWKERWTSAGPFGRTILHIDEALRFIGSSGVHRRYASAPETSMQRGVVYRISYTNCGSTPFARMNSPRTLPGPMGYWQ